MKKKKVIVLIISSIFIFYSFIGCHTDIKLETANNSYNIKESIKHGFFISKYIASKSTFNLNDTIYKINETWTEHEWEYKNDDLELGKTGRINFIIHFENDRVERIVYKKDDFSQNGMGWTNHKLFFHVTENEIKKDTMKLYFFIKKDTIPVLFFKKK